MIPTQNAVTTSHRCKHQTPPTSHRRRACRPLHRCRRGSALGGDRRQALQYARAGEPSASVRCKYTHRPAATVYVQPPSAAAAAPGPGPLRGDRRPVLPQLPRRLCDRGHALLVGLGAERDVDAGGVCRAQRIGAHQAAHRADLAGGGGGCGVRAVGQVRCGAGIGRWWQLETKTLRQRLAGQLHAYAGPAHRALHARAPLQPMYIPCTSCLFPRAHIR